MQADRAVVLGLLLERICTAGLSQLFLDAREHLDWHLSPILVIVGILASVFFRDEPPSTPLLLHEKH